MIGKKINIESYKQKGNIKKQNNFLADEILLTHFDTLSNDSKKIAKSYFKKNIHQINGFRNLTLEEAIQQYLFEIKAKVPFPALSKEEAKFTFIDLFAGIGGFRLAMQSLGGKCVFSSEYDKYAQQTYYANFGEIPFGDITKSETKSFIPKKFDILCAGFPCQPFSIAGVAKKNSLGRKHGFEDVKQGNLFFHIAEIIKEHRPKAFFLENVKNLVSHDKGNTFKVIKNILEELGYSFDSKVLDGKHFVPQHRERTIIVGFDKSYYGSDISFDFNKVVLPEPNHKIKKILDKKVDPKYTLSNHLWNYLQEYAKKHKAKGNGFGFGLVNLEGISRTMSARYYKDGAEILIPQENRPPRRLTPKECAALQGFPFREFKIPVSDNQAYKQFGNSVVMPLIKSVGEQIAKIIARENDFK
ncbi:MAG: DNA (cytosine-5-)-methyltransferase [Bacteroidetes bacterium]|nr:DNA (cytosine-5-)-methyltransferase [Bacteroidota bacterium]